MTYVILVLEGAVILSIVQIYNLYIFREREKDIFFCFLTSL